MSLARPETREEWRHHWEVVFFCAWATVQLRERQERAAWLREHGPRCGGCGGPRTRLVPDVDENGEELCPVPLCDTCTIADATPHKHVLFSWQATPSDKV